MRLVLTQTAREQQREAYLDPDTASPEALRAWAETVRDTANGMLRYAEVLEQLAARKEAAEGA